MAKPQPPDTTSHTLFLPNELDRKIKTLAKYGTAYDLIIKCIEDGIAPHWKEWIAQEYAKVTEGVKHENGQRTIRRSSPPETRAANKDQKKNSKVLHRRPTS